MIPQLIYCVEVDYFLYIHYTAKMASAIPRHFVAKVKNILIQCSDMIPKTTFKNNRRIISVDLCVGNDLQKLRSLRKKTAISLILALLSLES